MPTVLQELWVSQSVEFVGSWCSTGSSLVFGSMKWNLSTVWQSHGAITKYSGNQFPSEHVAIQSICKTFRPWRSSSVTKFCNWRRPSQSKRYTNWPYCYMFTRKLITSTLCTVAWASTKSITNCRATKPTLVIGPHSCHMAEGFPWCLQHHGSPCVNWRQSFLLCATGVNWRELVWTGCELVWTGVNWCELDVNWCELDVNWCELDSLVIEYSSAKKGVELP